MSFRVAVVCEDHTLDQYVVRPVFTAMLADLGRPRAVVRVVTDPKLGGISDLRRELPSIVRRYSVISDLVVIALDADGEDGSEGRNDRKASFETLVPTGTEGEKAEVVVAVQELEVWALWGVRSEILDAWAEVRGEVHPKEVYFDQFVTDADRRSPGRGRARLIDLSLASGWRSLATGCPELGVLEGAVRPRLGP